jgi:hypothetical protein
MTISRRRGGKLCGKIRMAEHRRKPRPTVVPRFWTEEQVAWRLGMSIETLRRRIDTLTAEGMPDPDPLFLDRWDIDAVEHWLDVRAGLTKARDEAPVTGYEAALQNGQI